MATIVKRICRWSHAGEYALESEELDNQLIGHEEPPLCDLHPPPLQAEKPIIQETDNPIRCREIFRAKYVLECLHVQSGPESKSQHQTLGSQHLSGKLFAAGHGCPTLGDSAYVVTRQKLVIKPAPGKISVRSRPNTEVLLVLPVDQIVATTEAWAREV